MNKERLKKKIFDFRQKISAFRELLLRSRDRAIPEIIKNHEEIKNRRSELNSLYGELEKYIIKLGKKPRMSDGVNPVIYPVYENAFSADILLRVGPSLDAVLQDLDYISGKLNSMGEDEFKEIINFSQKSGGLPGVSITARNIENEGEISSRGPNAKTKIITENYKGTGSVKSIVTDAESKRTWIIRHVKEIIIGIIIVVVGGVILSLIL